MLDQHTAGPVQRTPQVGGQGRGLIPRRPKYATGCDEIVADVHAVIIDLRDDRVGAHLDIQMLKVSRGPLGQRFGEPGEHPRASFHQNHARLARVDPTEVALERLVRDLRDGPGELHAGRTAPDDNECHERIALHRIHGPFGVLERDQEPATDLQRIFETLESRGMTLPLVVPEVRVPGSRGHQQVVIADRAHGIAEIDLLPRDIDRQHTAEQNGHVALITQHPSYGHGDVTWRQRRGRHLIEQRLEQMMIGAVDERDVDRSLAELARGRKAGESAAEDDDVRARGSHSAIMAGSLMEFRRFPPPMSSPTATTVTAPITLYQRNATSGAQ